MKNYAKLGFVLLVISGIATGLLAYVNSITKPIIDENKRITEELARKEVMVDSENKEADIIFTEIGTINDKVAYTAKNKKTNQIIGYTFVASKYGYSSDIRSMVGVTAEFSIKKVKILEQSETPGLGANCLINLDSDGKKYTLQQFIAKNCEDLTVDKDGGKIISITGATITTRAITKSLDEGLAKLKKLIGEGV
ncbi:MAG: FMN-binding protein [Candidatus Cloacimonetes bacterium]|nr:FMN-binding protein [Candidatus Cloacimonadota bacterium]